MQLSIATVSLSGDLNEKLEAIAAAGFEGVEIFENDLLSFSGTPKDIKANAERLGLKILTFQPFRDFEGMPDEQRERTFARAERKFDLMGELGCDLLMVCSNVSPQALGGIDRAAKDLHELGERAQKRGMRVAFEALAWGRHINDYRDAWEAVRRADHPALGLVLDTFHIMSRKTDLNAIDAIPPDRIFLVQIVDAPVLDMDYLSWSRHFRCFPGQGDFPLGDFMERLQTTGYAGPLSLEIFNQQFRAGSAKSVAIDGRRSLIYMLDQLRTRTGKPSEVIPDLPPRQKCHGVEFIEFAIDETGREEFEKVLSSLGFTKAGTHKSKAVTRWRQGDINIVVNTHKEGFANAYYITHGPSVCAIGLKVEDAASTFERAQKLLNQPFSEAVGPGELQIPSVRGLGGSLLYFVDAKSELAKVWDIEFTPEKKPNGNAPPAAGLTVTDHISQSMQYEEMLTWLLFYASLLDVKKTSQQDVIDPGGLVLSQVVESDDGALRVILNGSQSHRTQSSKFLHEFFGSGVQHVAFATEDIFATAARLRENGVKLLDIPENYYDDLEARTDLTGEVIDKLRTLNILYDREGNAEYFQVYTQAYEERFFFEVVQRRGYKGFGGINAPIRLAAQARVSAADADL